MSCCFNHLTSINKFSQRSFLSASSTYRVMPKLSTCSAIWILILLFDFTVPENKPYPKRNNSLLDPREENLIHGLPRTFRRRKLLSKNKPIETIGLLNEISQFKGNQTVRKTNFIRGCENVIGSINKTLIDYNGPAIMENLDNKNDFTSHVRVKRSEPTNDSITRHQSNHSKNFIDSFPLNFWIKPNAVNVSGDLMSKFEGLSVDSDRRNQSDILSEIDTSYSRHKRSALYKNDKRKKRMKGNVRHSKRRMETKSGNKKHSTSKSFHKSTKKVNNSKKGSKKTREIEMLSKTVGEPQIESRIEKRELGNNPNTDVTRTSITDYEKTGLLIDQKENALLSNNRSFDEQRGRNSVALPFVHTGKAELRVHIEKIPTNKTSFLNPNNNRIEFPLLTALPKSDTSDEIFDANVTNLELTSNLDPTVKKEVNLTMEITLKKLDYKNNVSCPQTNDSEKGSFYNEGSSIESNLPRVEVNRNEKYKLSDEDTKSRAKRNQEITSKRYLRRDRNAIGSKRLKDAGQRASIEGMKHEKTRRRRARSDRAVRSVEEIKELAEKLIIKINELQIYVSNRNRTLYTTDSCPVKNADRVAIEEASGMSLEEKGVPSPKSKIAENADNRRCFAGRNSGQVATSTGRTASQMSSGGSRFSREENRVRKSRRKWGKWMDWSSCSVTCGKGRQIRWRHCLRDCNDAETEMEEKACQLPACPPGKFLGIF